MTSKIKFKKFHIKSSLFDDDGLVWENKLGYVKIVKDSINNKFIVSAAISIFEDEHIDPQCFEGRYFDSLEKCKKFAPALWEKILTESRERALEFQFLLESFLNETKKLI